MEGRIKIYFDDGQKISWRIGLITSEDDFSITLNYKESIPKRRIIRMEVMDK